MALRIRVDLTRCAGYGICALLLGQRIDLDSWGFPLVDPSGVEGRRLSGRARRAAAACPRRALLIEEDLIEEEEAGDVARRAP